jgi:hypothetical protein
MRNQSAAGRLLAIGSLLLLPACASETLFRSDFNGTAINQPPATAQPVGTAHVDGPAGSVKVIAAPVPPANQWVQVSRPNGPAVAGMQGKFSQFKGDGEYTFSAMMFMPAQSGVATVQFEPFINQPSDLLSFLHLDFMPDNKVRIDDNDATKFGTFARNEPFIVQVSLNINATQSTAHIVLAGANASGVKDHTIQSPFQNLSRQFGAIRIWQGFPHTGAFDATNITVTRKTE